MPEAAKDHGVHETTIYNWLGAGASGAPSWSEFARLKKERDDLLRLVDELTVKLSTAQKVLVKDGNKTALAKTLGCSRASLYYVSRLAAKDWASPKPGWKPCSGNIPPTAHAVWRRPSPTPTRTIPLPMVEKRETEGITD